MKPVGRVAKFSEVVANDPALQAVCEDLLLNGRHWELTSYEWNPRTGVSRFGYTHRHTGKHMECVRKQTRYVVAPSREEYRRAA